MTFSPVKYQLLRFIEENPNFFTLSNAFSDFQHLYTSYFLTFHTRQQSLGDKIPTLGIFGPLNFRDIHGTDSG